MLPLSKLSDGLMKSRQWSKFKAMQSSLYTCSFVSVLGGGLFLFCSLFLVRDKAKAEALTQGQLEVIPTFFNA